MQAWSPFNLREAVLISWCGLRGAVPLALSLAAVEAIPTLPGIDRAVIASLQTNAAGIVFTVVVLNLLLQGLSLPHLSRWLGLQPDAPDGPPAAEAAR
jgi:cell volume regulation protein A